jgi:hypothetical protein
MEKMEQNCFLFIILSFGASAALLRSGATTPSPFLLTFIQFAFTPLHLLSLLTLGWIYIGWRCSASYAALLAYCTFINFVFTKVKFDQIMGVGAFRKFYIYARSENLLFKFSRKIKLCLRQSLKPQFFS